MILPSHIKLVIFDVDGTLVTTKSGATFRKSADDWQWLPGRLERLHQLDAQGIYLAIATNQGGVAFGHLVYYEMRYELRRLADEGRIDFTAICFTHPQAKIEAFRQDSDRRKPGPGMLLDAMEALKIGPIHTLMVGDRPEDEQAAQNAGVAFMWADEFFGDKETEQ
jgi:D-glycero-D-manno-heptose 1,7-bisphosphate phosphatase